MKRIFTGVIAVFILAVGVNLHAADDDLSDVRREIAQRHDEAVERLRQWIALPSIAAENRNYPEGAEYMADLLRDAGFQRAEVVETDGKPGVFATLDAGAPRRRSASTSCTTSSSSSPPSGARRRSRDAWWTSPASAR